MHRRRGGRDTAATRRRPPGARERCEGKSHMCASGLGGCIVQGFAGPPACREAAGDETLYRVFGGMRGIVGCFFSFEDPAGVSAAEFNANIAKWGDPGLYVARFRPQAGTPMHVGRIDPGFAGPGLDAFVGSNPDAQQVWIELRHVLGALTLVGRPRTLLQERAAVLREGRR